MLIYEKDNKLNISFENNMEETDIEIGKDEVKIGEATISESNVLPVPEEGDTGKVPTVQEDGSYALANAGGGSAPFVVNLVYGEDTITLDKTYAQISEAIADGKRVLFMFVGKYTDYFYLQQYGVDASLNSYVVVIMGVFSVSVETKRFSAESENGVLTAN